MQCREPHYRADLNRKASYNSDDVPAVAMFISAKRRPANVLQFLKVTRLALYLGCFNLASHFRRLEFFMLLKCNHLIVTVYVTPCKCFLLQINKRYYFYYHKMPCVQ